MIAVAKQYFTRKEVAKIFGVCTRTIDIAIRQKRLRSVRFGKAVRIPATAVEQYSHDNEESQRIPA